MTQTYLNDYFVLEREKLYRKLVTANKEEVFDILAMIKALANLETSLNRDYKSGEFALEELELENSES